MLARLQFFVKKVKNRKKAAEEKSSSVEYFSLEIE